ncbi:hypothetical protein XF14_09445 [Burkholderia gladioli]|nr:hypothetical protein XF14_09445 [Burkholderia gladioli]
MHFVGDFHQRNEIGVNVDDICHVGSLDESWTVAGQDIWMRFVDDECISTLQSDFTQEIFDCRNASGAQAYRGVISDLSRHEDDTLFSWSSPRRPLTTEVVFSQSQSGDGIAQRLGSR